MFLFNCCCQHFQTGDGYEVRQLTNNKKASPTFSHSLQAISNDTLLKQTNQVIRIKRSQYEQLIHSFKDTKKMWIDQEFPPEKDSLGDIKIQAKWKRLSQIVQNPSVFSGKLSPSIMMEDYKEDIFLQSSFYCTIAALSQHEDLIKNLFAGVEYSKAGLYKVPLRIDGQIQEILIDDFIPVRTNGIPIFSSSVSNEIWLYLLEKAWAKVNHGYSNINKSPKEIMNAFTWAPCQQIYMKQGEDENKKFWDKLLTISNKKFPCVCETISSEESNNDLSDAGLVQCQYYSMLEAFNIEDQKGRPNQVMKMQSFIFLDRLKIKITEGHNLWSLIAQHEKGKNCEISEMKRENIFYIRYQDFSKYFAKITLSYYEPYSNYLSETLFDDLSRGFLYKFDVIREGRYNIELHQPEPFNYKQQENEKAFKRGTIILIKDLNGQLSFIEGILSMTQKDTLLSADLSAGKYVLYCKLDSNKQPCLSIQHSISVYSRYFTKLIKTSRSAYPNILQHTFLNYGRQNPRNKHNNDLMWISYRLLYKQGGFAFIALGNKLQSNKKFLITFDEKDFIKMNFKLKKPFKNVDQVQTLEVLPGQEKIILARCANNQNLKSLKFPPQLGIKIQPVDKT